MGPITLNPPASVHVGSLANEIVLPAPNCAIVPKMTSVRTQSQWYLHLIQSVVMPGPVSDGCVLTRHSEYKGVCPILDRVSVV